MNSALPSGRALIFIWADATIGPYKRPQRSLQIPMLPKHHIRQEIEEDAEEKLREERKQHRAVRGLHGCRSGIGPAQIVHRVREQTVERRVTYHAGENCDAEDLQNGLNRTAGR